MVTYSRRALYYFVTRDKSKTYGETIRKASKRFKKSEAFIDHEVSSMDLGNEYGDR